MTKVGIEALYVYSPEFYVDNAELAVARGSAPKHFTEGVGVKTFSVSPPNEDQSSMAATAAYRLMETYGISPKGVQIDTPTESGLDSSRALVSDVVGHDARSKPSLRKYSMRLTPPGPLTPRLISATPVRRNRRPRSRDSLKPPSLHTMSTARKAPPLRQRSRARFFPRPGIPSCAEEESCRCGTAGQAWLPSP